MSKMTKKFTLNLSTLLQLGNLITCLLAILLYVEFGANEFVDVYTIYLTCFFSFQNILMLSYQKKSLDPFLLILVLVTTLFYLTRVPSLLYEPWSLALFRYPFTAEDLNHAFLFICISNISIFMGLITARGWNFFRVIDYDRYKPGKFTVIALILLFTLFSNYFFILGVESLGRLSSFISGLLMPTRVILLLTITYTLLNYKHLSGAHKTILLLLFLLFIVVTTLFGSRSSFLTFFILVLCVMLSFKGVINFRKSAVVGVVLLIPIMLFSFVVATHLRDLGYDPKTVISSERIAYLKDLKLHDSDDNVRMTLRPVLDRVGFLSYSADVISNSEEYRQIINGEYYFKSIVDNLFTPGFSVFDTPKAANALRYIYLDIKSNPTHQDVIDVYSSDMFTVYGEYYVLFGGYPALIFLFLFSYIFKRLYLSIRTKNVFSYYLFRSLVLLIFYNWLNSFGLDWMLVDIVSLLIPIYLWKWFYSMRSRKLYKRKPSSEMRAV